MYQSFYTGALGAGTCMAKMDMISNNLANINNNGFRPQAAAFTDLLQFNLNDSETAVTELQSGNGVRMQRTYRNFETTTFNTTKNSLDFAISNNNAFFMVRDPATGEVTYTRTGRFHRGRLGEGGEEGQDGDFYLLTEEGKLVLDQNGEPLRAEVPDLERLLAMMQDDYEPEEIEEEGEAADVPRLSLYTFSNPTRLMNVGDNEFAPPEGMEPILVENPRITSGALEASGTNLSQELIHMIECQRAYTYALKMVTTADEIESTINSLR